MNVYYAKSINLKKKSENNSEWKSFLVTKQKCVYFPILSFKVLFSIIILFFFSTIKLNDSVNVDYSKLMKNLNKQLLIKRHQMECELNECNVL